MDNNIFESIKHFDEEENEYWEARELGKVLSYSEYRKFLPIIEKSKIACFNSGQIVSEHFVHMVGMVDIGSSAKRKVSSYKLSRYACYIIAQNADSRKEVVALAQTYFTVQTRRQELLEKEYGLMSEDEKRFYQRSLTRKGKSKAGLIK